MPRIPGREPTRRTVDSTDGLLIGSFAMEHETHVWKRPCLIKDCDHRLGPDTSQPGWAGKYEPCSRESLPAHVVASTAIHRPLGMLCPCHAAEVLNAEWPA